MSIVIPLVLALALVVPIVAVGTHVAVRRGALPARALAVVIGMNMLLLLVGVVVAVVLHGRPVHF